MKVSLLNFVGGPGVPLLNFEGEPGVPLLNFEGGPGPGSEGPEVLVPLLHHAAKERLFQLDLSRSSFKLVIQWNLSCNIYISYRFVSQGNFLYKIIANI